MTYTVLRVETTYRENSDWFRFRCFECNKLRCPWYRRVCTVCREGKPCGCLMCQIRRGEA